MSRALPEIWIERNDSDVPSALWPDREFWRYLFAGMAMQGLLANPEGDGPDEAYALGARELADALLAGLEKEAEDGTD